MLNDSRGLLTERKRVLAKKLDAAGWGLFFIWIGIAALAGIGWGVLRIGRAAISGALVPIACIAAGALLLLSALLRRPADQPAR